MEPARVVIPGFVLMKRTVSLVAGVLLCGLAGCGRGPEVRLLLDGDHAPDVLTEQRRIAHPPTLGGNRFLNGWWPWSFNGRLALSPPVLGAKVRMEVVHLGGEARTLLIDVVQEAPRRTVRVWAAGRDLGAFPLTDPVRVPLPADLPLGRVPIDLQFQRGPRGVLAAGVEPSRLAGKVHLDGADVLQSGDSLTDFVHRVSGGETLVGTFVPPGEPRPGQRFELIVEREPGKPLQRFSWEGGEERRIALPVGDAPGFVRVRLLARGQGPEGRWEGLGFTGGRGTAEPREALAEAPVRKPPKVVIVYVMDALRADAVGQPGVSPTFDRLAREGVTFRHHRSIAPNTIPSTKALFTGRPVVTGGDSPLGDEGTTLAERFRDAGYRTGLFSGNIYVSSSFHTDRGFEHVADEVLMDADGAGPDALNDNAAQAHAAALSWLRTLDSGERAFLYFHTIHPHNPYAPPEPYRRMFTSGIRSSIDGSTETLMAVRKGGVEAGPADQERLRGLYKGSFAFNDAELGRFLEQVKRWAPPGEVMVVLTSDHGEELFDHGGVLHGYTLYEEMLDIPLVFWWPGHLRPALVEEPTDTLDVNATLIELCGLGRPDGSGRPLLGKPPKEDSYIHLAAASSVIGGIYSAQAGKWKLVWAPRFGTEWGMGDGSGRTRDPEYLFDLEKDPGERVNLAGESSLEVAWLRSRLLAWIQRYRSEEPVQKPQPVDAETERRLRALGYSNAR
jgi:arylsulfatase A-like enzyme